VISVDALAPIWNPDGVPSTATTTGNVATPELVDAIVLMEVTLPVAGAAIAVGEVAPLEVPLVLDRAPPVAPAPANPPPGKAPPPGPNPPPPPVVVLLDALVGVTVADWPSFRLPIVVVSTLRFTTYAELTTSICALVDAPDDELADELAALAFDPVPVAEALADVDAAVRPDPVPVPLRFVPVAPVEPSTSPTLRFMVATVPAIGDVSVAPLRSLFAEMRLAYAAVTAA
jgi:hypothetical protein